MEPNNVTRMLDQRKIPYTTYELPPCKLSAIEVAHHLGVSPDMVYKTIVVNRLGRGKPILAIIPGNSQVHLKELAKVIGEKKVSLPTERQAEQITGLQAGGISPLALLHRGFQIMLDERAKLHTEIYISAGQRGLDIRLPVDDLIKLTNAEIAPISQPTS